MRKILERTIEPSKHDNGFVMYEWSIYERGSVLEGQDCKSFGAFADTVEELLAEYPTATVDERDAGNTFDHLPGEEWDDAHQEYRW